MEYKCNICNKKYKSYKSLWNHNKKFHITNVDNKCLLVNKNTSLVNPGKHTAENLLICYYCNKTFNKRQSRWRHEKICKNKN
jgi:superfamily II helicase